MPQTDVSGAMQLAEELRTEVAENARPAPEAERGDDQRRDRDVRPQAARQLRGRSSSPPTRRCTPAKQGGRDRIALFRDPSETQRSPAADQDDDGADPRRPHPRPPQPSTPSRSAASPPAGSSATSCCCGWPATTATCCRPPPSSRRRSARGWSRSSTAGSSPARSSCSPRASARAHPVSLHVNLSGASLTDLSVLEFIERKLDEGDADPSRCTFEITATTPVEDYDTALGVRRPPHRVRLPGRDRRLRRRLRPLPLPRSSSRST